MRRLLHSNKMAGLSLAELMVGVAITGIVSVFAMSQFSDFTRRKWEAETKASSVAETELAAQVIKKTLPQFLPSVVGDNGETVPPSSFWSCTSTSCIMNINYQYTNIEGVAANSSVTPMRADCVSIQDSRLASAVVGLDEKATLPFPAPPAARTSDDPSCLSCATGLAPQLTVNTYNFDSTSGAPSVAATFKYPKVVGSLTRQGNLAMGVCVKAPAYQENEGTVAQPLIVNRYDRWKVTLVPVYPRLAPSSQRSDAQIKSDLQAPFVEILISASQRFAPGFRVIPIK